MNDRTNDDDAATDSITAMRRRAEAVVRQKLRLSPETTAEVSHEAMQHTLHQLQVHQIELEMQNEELRLTQLQLDTERARYFDLYDLAPVGYCTVSEQGLILEANIMAAKLLGMSRHDLVQQRVSRFIVKAHQDRFYLQRQQLIESGEPQSCELQMLKPDGTQFWTHLTATIETRSDEVIVLRMVISDITERKLAEIELARLNQALKDKNIDLERATHVAEKANLAKSVFLSNMSHELRTPLHAILGFTQLIESGSPPPTPDQKISIEQILRAGWYLLELIDEILNLAAVESGKLSLSLEPTSLNEVMRECHAMIEPQALSRHISISYCPFEIEQCVSADPIRLKQVFINLLSNAIKYNKVGGTVTVTFNTVSRERIRIYIEDSGAGLPAEKLLALFQPFNRLGQEGGQQQGTGIGLALSKRLTELMGGTIGVDSTVGKGSTFWVELALASPPLAVGHTAERVVTQAAVVPDTNLRTLLYVEDNPANLMLIENLIARRPNIRLLCASNGSRGIDIARSAQPDVILMDISLPDMNGFQVLQTLAKNTLTAHIPVIALSANAIPSDIAKGLEAGFFRYLTKPIRINEFMQVLDAALKSPQAEAIKPVIQL